MTKLSLEVNAKLDIMKVFTEAGLLTHYVAHCYGSAGPGWRVPDGDTPPGLYRIVQVDPIPITDPERDAFGPYFIALSSSTEEASVGRAGVGIHGGGTGLPGAYTAQKQGWEVTNGCVRLQNGDLLHLVELIRQAEAKKITPTLTVTWG